MSQKTQKAFDKTLGIGCLLSIALCIPMGFFTFDPSHHTDTTLNGLSVIGDMTGMIMMMILFFRTFVRVMNQ